MGAIAIAPDGTWLATGSGDGTARIWAPDGTPRATLTGHGSEVRAIAIAPDGTLLAIASTDRTARIWAPDDMSGSGVTAIRTGGTISDCAWAPGISDLYIAGQKGLYKFAFRSPHTTAVP